MTKAQSLVLSADIMLAKTHQNHVMISDHCFLYTQYTVFHKKTPFVFFIIYSNDSQFTQN